MLIVMGRTIFRGAEVCEGERIFVRPAELYSEGVGLDNKISQNKGENVWWNEMRTIVHTYLRAFTRGFLNGSWPIQF